MAAAAKLGLLIASCIWCIVDFHIAPCSCLQALCPIARTPFGVGDRDDLNFAGKLAENNKEWVPLENDSPRPLQIRHRNVRSLLQPAESSSKFRIEAQRSRLASRPQILKSSVCFGLGLRVDMNGLHRRCLARVRASIRAITSSSGTSFTAPESISSSRRLISPSQAVSIKDASSESGPMLSQSELASKIR